jgi:hypothetical protein
VAENPLSKLSRVLGGVLLTQGRLGHQVLGQLLLGNSTDAAIAGASVVVTATAGQRDAVFQVALRTAVPALALAAIFRRREEQLSRLETILAQRERALGARSADFARRESNLRARDRAASQPDVTPRDAPAPADSQAAARLVAAETARAKARRMVVALEREQRLLRKQVVKLRARLAAQRSAPVLPDGPTTRKRPAPRR